jgi:hypothetical protein
MKPSPASLPPSSKNSAKMTTISDILKLPIAGKNVLIIGEPATGKTHLSGLLNSAGHTVIHTDDYIPHGNVESLYVLIDDLAKIDGPTIIEGVAGYRLLRKGVQLDCYYPDYVIELHTSEARVECAYREQRSEDKLKGLKGFRKALKTILAGYNELPNKRPPVWVQVRNEY